MKWTLLLAVLLFAAMGWSYARGAQAGPEIGETAPDFSLPDQAGKLQKLSAFRGQWVVLYFYPKDETPGCTTEACAFRDDWVALQALKVQVIGVSLDDSASHARFAEKFKLPFLLLADASGEVVTRYGAMANLLFFKLAKRHTYVIAPDGKIAQRYLDVDPGRHSREVIEFIQRRQSGV